MFWNRQEGMGLNIQVKIMTLDSNTGTSFMKAGSKAEYVSADSGRWWWEWEVLFRLLQFSQRSNNKQDH